MKLRERIEELRALKQKAIRDQYLFKDLHDYRSLCAGQGGILSDTIKAWHFLGDTLRDGNPVPKDGVWLKHFGPVVICQSGLHASRDPFDALQYAQGATLCRVEVRGDVQEQNDKLVARERRIIVRMDATEMLRYFSRMQALSVIHLYNNPPDVVLEYLMTGDEAIRAAAGAAAGGAARDAAGGAARADFNALVNECFKGAL